MSPERKAELLKRAGRFACSLTNPSEVGQLSRDVLEMAQALDAAERRAAEAEALLTRAIKYAREDEMQTPRATRLARVLAEAERALALASGSGGNGGGKGGGET